MPPSKPTAIAAASSANSSKVRRAPRRGSNLVLRIGTAAIGIPLVLAVNYVGGWLFAAAIGAVALIAEMELIRALRAGMYRPAAALCLAGAVGLAVVPMMRGDTETIWVGSVILIAGVTGAYYLRPGSYEGGLVNWCLSTMSALYVGLLLGQLVLLRDMHRGARWVVLVLLMTWAYDTGAYFTGRFAGRRPFMHHVSPKKTVEGVAGGLVLSAAAGVLAVPLVDLALWQGAALGLLTGAVAQAGDLIESMIKRQTGVKDSGGVLPGHGGLLDRIDSLLFTGALGYYAALALGHVS
jgi:phosphatidate cytidylyltransferase